MEIDRYQKVQVHTREQWRAWLEANHTQAESIWLVTFKKTSGKPHLSWSESVDEALCFGWIDSRPAKLDDERTMVLFSPRRKGSAWSKINKDKIERLTTDGLMHPAGIAKVERAKADGSWSALDEVEALVMPPGLVEALAGNPAAAINFEGFSRASKRGILDWIRGARTPETRARRIAQTADLAARNIKANHRER